MSNPSRFDELLQRLRDAERELENEMERLLEEKREKFHYHLEHGKVRFEQQVETLQRQYRIGTWRYLHRAKWRFILTAPVIYGMIIPLVIVDISFTLYQHICFRVYGIPRIKRGDFLVIDRHLLSYLNAIEKFNCVYCGYGNGIIAYAREITARTEQFWCPIKHATRTTGLHPRTGKFFEYGDASAWRNELKKMRKDWTDEA